MTLFIFSQRSYNRVRVISSPSSSLVFAVDYKVDFAERPFHGIAGKHVADPCCGDTLGWFTAVHAHKKLQYLEVVTTYKKPRGTFGTKGILFLTLAL